jgi:hypothetical protein
MIKLLGWKVMDGEVPEPKCIILGVPHTSIKDFIISWFFYTSVGGTANIMIKKEFFLKIAVPFSSSLWKGWAKW